MDAKEIEALDPSALEQVREQVIAFVRAASEPRDMAAAFLALGRLHARFGDYELAWQCLKEGERWYERCNENELALVASSEAIALERTAFPPFEDPGDFMRSCEGLFRALLGRADAKRRGEPVPASLFERESFRRRLDATVNHAIHPALALAQRLGLNSNELEILLTLFLTHTKANHEEELKRLGREEFLPGVSVRVLCQFLSGQWEVRPEWLCCFSERAPLVKYGVVKLRLEEGSTLEYARIFLSDVVLLFLQGCELGEVMRFVGAEPRSVVLTTDLSARVEEALALGKNVLICGSGYAQALDDSVFACKRLGKSPLLFSLSAGGPLGPASRFAQIMLAAKMFSTPTIVVLKEHVFRAEEGHTIEQQEEWLRTFAREISWREVPTVVIAPKDSEEPLCRAMSKAVVLGYARLEPDLLERRFAKVLENEGCALGSHSVKEFFRETESLDPDAVEDLAHEVATRQRSGVPWAVAMQKVFSATRATTFFGIAERLVTAVNWSDLVLPQEVLVVLNEVITYARYRDKVMKEWGFAQKMPYGKALTALFHGQPGTGKTLAACVIANDLGIEVFRIDLSQVVSKWVGETEKNLARVFDAASRTRALILFDEADSLFGRRTEVKTAVDRYSNLEVNYLLQRLEDFDGIAILTTNVPENIDQAFKRRIRFKVAFPFPDAMLRAELWRTLIPPLVPKKGRFDFRRLAEMFEFAGGNIRNAILRAAFRAASEDRPLTQDDLIEAARSEAKEIGVLVRA